MIGDVIASTVICSEIKKQFANYEVHYLIQPNTFAVVENNPHIDKVLFLDPKKVSGIPSLISFGKSLKNTGYQIVIDVYGKPESLIPTFFSGASTRIGFKKWYSAIFYTKQIIPALNVQGSAIFHRLQLAEALTGVPPKTQFPKIYLLDSEVNDAKEKLQLLRSDGSKIIMISVLGSGKDKSLPADAMAQTLDIVASTENIKMLFNFMPSQKDEALAIFNLCKQETRKKIRFDFYTSGLRDFLAVLSQCDALVGNEGGAVNMAKALNIPTFTIFSPWIKKSSWDMLTNGKDHVAVHLNDYHPEVYKGGHPKKLKSKAFELYQKLQPQLYRESLNRFIENVIS
jgi:heptosyltransferase-2